MIDNWKSWGKAGGCSFVAVLVLLRIPAGQRRRRSMLNAQVFLSILATLDLAGAEAEAMEMVQPSRSHRGQPLERTRLS
jgi:hypothetical protein